MQILTLRVAVLCHCIQTRVLCTSISVQWESGHKYCKLLVKRPQTFMFLSYVLKKLILKETKTVLHQCIQTLIFNLVCYVYADLCSLLAATSQFSILIRQNMQLTGCHNGNEMRNATCADTQISIEWPYCSFPILW